MSGSGGGGMGGGGGNFGGADDASMNELGSSRLHTSRYSDRASLLGFEEKSLEKGDDDFDREVEKRRKKAARKLVRRACSHSPPSRYHP